MKTKLAILGAVIALGLSGCGSNPKSVDELATTHTPEELEKMFYECKIGLDDGIESSEAGIKKAMKQIEEREEIINKIYESRGKKAPMGASSFFNILGNVTDEELSKFGNKDFGKHVACGRIFLAKYKKKDLKTK